MSDIKWKKRELGPNECPEERTLNIGNTDIRLVCDVPVTNHFGNRPHDILNVGNNEREGRKLSHRCELADGVVVLWA